MLTNNIKETTENHLAHHSTIDFISDFFAFILFPDFPLLSRWLWVSFLAEYVYAMTYFTDNIMQEPRKKKNKQESKNKQKHSI